jgi:hypothetical protein
MTPAFMIDVEVAENQHFINRLLLWGMFVPN